MIRLTDDYYIDMDERNYILCWDYKKVDKKGNMVYKPLGYFGSIKDLLNYWAEMSVKNALSKYDTLTLGEAVEVIRKELNEVKKLISDAISDISVYTEKA